MDKKIDIVLLAGFLGAGKTTVLNELIRQFQDMTKIGMLVNDFGEVPVDGSLLENENPSLLEDGHKIYEIGNGSIFCSCLKAPFLYGLKYFEKERPELLFIEASGLSDPSSMDKILKDHHLETLFRVKKVLTLVDPVRYIQLTHVLDVIPRQVLAADVLLVNKEDQVSPEELEDVKGQVRSLNKEAEMQTGSFGQFDFSFLRESSRKHAMVDRESCNTPENRPASLFLEGTAADEAELMAFLEGVEQEVYRLKGFIPLGGTLSYVSDTGRGFSINPAPKSGIKPGLTVLCPRENSRRVFEAWKTFQANR